MTKIIAIIRLLVAMALICEPIVAPAQPANRIHQIGWLSGTAVSSPESLDAFRNKLAGFGWLEGRDFVFVFRHGDEHGGQLAQRADELVRMNVDVIVATVPAALAAAHAATRTVPIVMVYGPDPVDAGVVSSLARPQGNITGVTSLSADLAPKQLDLLKAIVPGVSRVAVLWNPGNPWHGKALSSLEAASRRLGILVRSIAVRRSDDLNPAFLRITKERADAILSLSDPITFSSRAQLAELALRHRLPLMSGVIEYTEAGGLASYWPNSLETFRSVAVYVHRIINGARPADLPIEQPKTFEFVINLKTAKALGLTIPPPALARADRVIE